MCEKCNYKIEIEGWSDPNVKVICPFCGNIIMEEEELQ